MTRENSPSSAWAHFSAHHAAGDTVRATVTKTTPFGALVEIDGVPGLLTGSQGLAVGDRVAGRIGALDSARQRFSMLG